MLIALLLQTSLGFAQEKLAVTGAITDETGESLPGVFVSVKGTNNATIADEEGKYTLTVSGNDVVLVFSFMGYATQEIAVGNRSVVNVSMNPDVKIMDEVVVVGYGEQSRRTVTSAISKLGGEALRDIPIALVGEGLKGKVAGLKVVQHDNSPGSELNFRIRGGSSINNSNTPLILVDGVERSFAGVNPNDILSIDVLKDAASSAIYGARASNGVILVTTKKGGYNQPFRVVFEANMAYQDLETKIDFLNAEDYINILRPAVLNSRNPNWNFASGYSASSGNEGDSIYSTRYYNPGDPVPAGWKTMVDPIDPNRMLMFQDNDWQDLMYNPAIWQNYYLSVEGGSKQIRYMSSVGYTADEGVAMSTGYDRFNFKISGEARITDKLTASAGMDYSITNTEYYSNQRNMIARGLSCPPTQFVYLEDGTPAPGYNNEAWSPIFYNHITDRNHEKKYVSLNAGLKYDIIDGLTANLTGSYYDSPETFKSFTKANFFSSARESRSEYYLTNRKKFEGYLKYDKTLFTDHNLSVMAGYSYQSRHYESLVAAAEGGSSDDIPTMNAAPVKKEATSTEQDEVQIGYFGRLNYDYQGKYLFTATFREDASSKFIKDNRWGFFPGVSAGWILSEESWMNSLKQQISYLKARVSYGQTGNNGIGIYDALGQFDPGYKYDSNAGIRATTMANTSLQWETSTQLDLGVEIGLLKDRIYLSADYFDKRTDNLLYEKTLPNTTGFSSVQTNIGRVKFYGFEIELTTRNIEKKDFSWSTKLVFSLTQNVVLKLPDNGLEKNRVGGIALGDGTYFGGIAEGEPLYRHYGYVVDHIIQNETDAANARWDNLARGYNPADGTTVAGRKFPGDYEWKDRNGDGLITTADRFLLGVTEAPINGGINNNFRWKNINVNLYLDYAMGHTINDVAYGRYFYATFSTNYALAEEVKNTWKQEGDNTRLAKFNANDSGAGNDNYNRRSDVFNYKGDYLCIREVTIQYDFPKKLLNKINMKGLTLTLSGNNLYYFTAVKGISPEAGTGSTYSDDATYYNYPPIRRISLGARITF
jgi:TonB-linked SusC/RagA family outer membrane protein